jgi:hypothetical protein
MAVWDWSAVKKLFDLLKQQKTYIFVSAHIDVSRISISARVNSFRLSSIK